MKRVVRKSKIGLDSLEKLPIVKSSDEKTSREGVGSTDTGLTGHADIDSMAAESYSNLALSSRQLLKPAPAAGPALGDSLRSRRVEYIPPSEAEVGQYARDVCAALSEAIPSARFSDTEVRVGFQQFMMVVARIVAKQASQKGTPWRPESDKNPPPSGQ